MQAINPASTLAIFQPRHYSTHHSTNQPLSLPSHNPNSCANTDDTKYLPVGNSFTICQEFRWRALTILYGCGDHEVIVYSLICTAHHRLVNPFTTGCDVGVAFTYSEDNLLHHFHIRFEALGRMKRRKCNGTQRA